jgi:hypothetical protein
MRRAAIVALCAATLLASGCASRNNRQPNALIVPVSYERHLAAVRNCKPVGTIETSLTGIPDNGNFLALAFALGSHGESSTSHSYSGGTTWQESSWKQGSLVGYRIFECPPAFMETVRAGIKGKEGSK